MRHRRRGRVLGRNPSHQRALLRSLASNLFLTERDTDDLRFVKLDSEPNVKGRIVTTVAKAKELRPIVEKLVTIAKKSLDHQEKAEEHASSAERNSSEWKTWRESDKWNQWAKAVAPAVALRRRAFAVLRDNTAVDILFDELATRYRDRPGGYTRVIRLAAVRLGDAGPQALIEFVGERDRVKQKRRVAPVVADDSASEDSKS